MSYAGIPQTPFILAFVLGTTLEGNFRKAISYAKGDWFAFFTRPVSCIFIVIGIVMIIWPLVKTKIPLLGKAKAE